MALGAKGSVRDRLTPSGRAPGFRPREVYSTAALARYGAEETALAEAKVLHASESRVKAGFIAGEDITDRIAEAKADAEDARALATEGAGAGRNHESGGLGGRQAESKHSDKDIDTKGLFS